jgi:hypothetical protein
MMCLTIMIAGKLNWLRDQFFFYFVIQVSAGRFFNLFIKCDRKDDTIYI